MNKIYFATLVLILFIARSNMVLSQACNAGIVSAQHDSVCAEGVIFLHTTGSKGIIQWQTANSSLNFSNIFEANDTFCSQIPSSYNFFRLIATGNGCSDTSSVIRITVFADARPYITYTIMGDTVSFNSSGSQYATSFSWDFGDGDTSTQSNPVHIYTRAGTYLVGLFANNAANCSVYSAESIAVGCKAYFSLVADTAHPGLYLGYNYSTGKNLNYQWSFGDGGTSSGCCPTYYYIDSGSYKICLTVSNDSAFGNECISTYCINNFNVAGPGLGEITILNATGIQEPRITSNQIQVSPNPCNTCRLTGINNINDIYITDVLGRQVIFSASETSGGFYISLHASASGIYFVRDLKTGEVVKFVKE